MYFTFKKFKLFNSRFLLGLFILALSTTLPVQKAKSSPNDWVYGCTFGVLYLGMLNLLFEAGLHSDFRNCHSYIDNIENQLTNSSFINSTRTDLNELRYLCKSQNSHSNNLNGWTIGTMSTYSFFSLILICFFLKKIVKRMLAAPAPVPAPAAAPAPAPAVPAAPVAPAPALGIPIIALMPASPAALAAPAPAVAPAVPAPAAIPLALVPAPAPVATPPDAAPLAVPPSFVELKININEDDKTS